MDSSRMIVATAAGTNENTSFIEQAHKALSLAGVHRGTPCKVEFGLLGNAREHRGVIFKVFDEENLSFRLDLTKREVDRKQFTCPKCKSEIDTSQGFFDHLEKDHNLKACIQNCCGEDFKQMIHYKAHVYDKHYAVENVDTVALLFQRIGNHMHSYEEFMDSNKDKITFYPNHPKYVTFDDLLTAALSIIKQFGSYFVFFWNCQDFAAWFLTYSGIPLSEIDPTAMDRATGSGSSHRSVRDVKGWLYYKDLDETEKAKLKKYLPPTSLYRCDHCPYLPPLSIEDLNLHHKLSHSSSQVN